MQMDFTEIELILPKPPSLNMIYAGKHWTYRKKKKDEYKIICQDALSKYDKFTCEGLRMAISYNSRLDIDNGILVSKFLADTLVSEGIIPDDNKDYYTEVKIVYDGDLPKNTYKVILICKNLKYVEQP
jgi:hypothetical protein